MERKTSENLDQETEEIEVHTSHGAILPPPPEIAEQHYSDEILTRQLRDALIMDQRLTLAHVIGDVWDSIAYLTGEVRREEEITAAEEVAISIPGIRGVKQEIRINPNLKISSTPTEVF